MLVDLWALSKRSAETRPSETQHLVAGVLRLRLEVGTRDPGIEHVNIPKKAECSVFPGRDVDDIAAVSLNEASLPLSQINDTNAIILFTVLAHVNKTHQ